MKDQIQILGLDEDILYLVLQQLEHDSPASLLNFAKASRACEKLASPILHRSVSLSDKGDEEMQRRTRQLFERLLDQNDPICTHVKELIIAEWGDEVDHARPQDTKHCQLSQQVSNSSPNSPDMRSGESRLLPSRELELVLGNMKSLACLGWNSKSLIPTTIISKLEQDHHHVKLCVTNNRRHHGDAHGAMDVRLLSSRLLSSLDYSIFHSSTPSGITCSEFQALKRCLLPGPRLTHLALGVYQKPRDNVQVPKAPKDWHTFLPAGSGGPIQSLHTLKIPDHLTFTAADNSKVYSSVFAQLQDFQNLHRVDLKNACSSYTFEALKGRVPNLKHLEFLYRVDNNHFYIQTKPSSVREFLGTINALENLRIVSYASSLNPILPALLQHRNTLQRLSIHSPPPRMPMHTGPPVLTCDQLEEAGNISHLALDVLISDITWFSKSDSRNKLDVDPSTAERLVDFSRCESLKLYVEFSNQESIFLKRVPSVAPALEEKNVEEVALELYQQIFTKTPSASLKDLEICFCRCNGAVETPEGMIPNVEYNSVWVKRVEIDKVNAPLDPGYRISSQKEWKHQRGI